MERTEELKIAALQKVQELKMALDTLSREISPKHWRSSGNHFHALREMEQQIPNYTEMSESERANPVVQEGLIVKGDYYRKKANESVWRILDIKDGEVSYQEVVDNDTKFVGGIKVEPIGEFLFKFEFKAK